MDPKVLSPDWGYYKTLCLRQTYGQSTLAWGSGCAERYQARKNCVILWSKHPGFLGGSGVKASACNVEDLGREDPLEKEMTIHSSIPAWRIPWMEEPGRLQSTGSQRVGYDWATSLTHSLTHSWSKQAIQWFQDFMCNTTVSTLSKRLQTPF